MTHTDEFTVTKTVETHEDPEDEDSPLVEKEVELGTVKVEELTTAEETRLLNQVAKGRGNFQPAEWFEQYFKKYVAEFEPSQELFRDLEFKEAPLTPTQMQNSSHPDLKKVNREVMGRIPNLNDVLGRNETE